MKIPYRVNGNLYWIDEKDKYFSQDNPGAERVAVYINNGRPYIVPANDKGFAADNPGAKPFVMGEKRATPQANIWQGYDEYGLLKDPAGTTYKPIARNDEFLNVKTFERGKKANAAWSAVGVDPDWEGYGGGRGERAVIAYARRRLAYTTDTKEKEKLQNTLRSLGDTSKREHAKITDYRMKYGYSTESERAVQAEASGMQNEFAANQLELNYLPEGERKRELTERQNYIESNYERLQLGQTEEQYRYYREERQAMQDKGGARKMLEEFKLGWPDTITGIYRSIVPDSDTANLAEYRYKGLKATETPAQQLLGSVFYSAPSTLIMIGAELATKGLLKIPAVGPLAKAAIGTAAWASRLSGYAITGGQVLAPLMKDDYDRGALSTSRILGNIANSAVQTVIEYATLGTQMGTIQNLGRDALEAMSKKYVRDAFSKLGLSYGKAMLTTGLQEGIEEVEQNITDKLFNLKIKGQALPDPEAWAKELAIDFAGGALGGVAFGVIGGGVNLLINQKVANAVNANAGRYPSIASLQQAIADFQAGNWEDSRNNLEIAKARNKYDKVNDRYIRKAFTIVEDALRMHDVGLAMEYVDQEKRLRQKVSSLESDFGELDKARKAGKLDDDTQYYAVEDKLTAARRELRDMGIEMERARIFGDLLQAGRKAASLEKTITDIQEQYADDPEMQERLGLAALQAQYDEIMQRIDLMTSQIQFSAFAIQRNEAQINFPQTQVLKPKEVKNAGETQEGNQPLTAEVAPTMGAQEGGVNGLRDNGEAGAVETAEEGQRVLTAEEREAQRQGITIEQSAGMKAGNVNEMIDKTDTGLDENVPTGKETEVKVSPKRKIKTRWALVSLQDLMTSHDEQSWGENAAYPGEIQNRNRDRDVQKMQVMDIEKDLDPEQVMGSYLAQSGAPIVFRDHNGRWIVLGGNGRVMGMKRRAESQGPEGMAAYEAAVREKLQELGFAEGTDTQGKVLVRVYYGEDDLVEMSREINTSDTSALSSIEQASSDAVDIANARRKGNNIIEKLDQNAALTPSANMEFYNAFFDLCVKDAADFKTRSGEYTSRMQERVEMAMFMYLFHANAAAERVLSNYYETEKSNIKNLISGVIDNLGPILKLRDLIETNQVTDLDISQTLITAMDDIARMRAGGVKLEQMLEERDLFSEGEELVPAKLHNFYRALVAIRSRKGARDFIGEYYGMAYDLLDPNQESIFGVTTESQETFFEQYVKEWNDDQAKRKAEKAEDQGGRGNVAEKPDQAQDQENPGEGVPGASETAGTGQREGETRQSLKKAYQQHKQGFDAEQVRLEAIDATKKACGFSSKRGDVVTHTDTGVIIDLHDGKRITLNFQTDAITIYDKLGRATGQTAAGETKYEVQADGKIAMIISLVDQWNGGNRAGYHENFHLAWFLFSTRAQRQWLTNYYSKRILAGQAVDEDGNILLLTEHESSTLTQEQQQEIIAKQWNRLTPKQQSIFIEEQAAQDAEAWNGRRRDVTHGFLEKAWQRFFDHFRNFLVSLHLVGEQAKLENIFWKAATGRMRGEGTIGETRHKILGTFAARALDAAEGVTWRMDDQKTAIAMDAQGKKPLQIKIATGWEKGGDGSWKLERPDAQADWGTLLTSGKREWTLGDVLDDTELFTAYPEMKDVKVVFDPEYAYQEAGFDPETREIHIGTDTAAGFSRSVDLLGSYAGMDQAGKADIDQCLSMILAHEIQHAIQFKEGFAIGAYTSGFTMRDYSRYWREAGEVEARNVGRRFGMTDEQRRTTTLQSTEDVKRKKQTVSRQAPEARYKTLSPSQSETFVVATPSQIKSATANVGTFDSENSDIRYKPIGSPNAAMRIDREATMRSIWLAVQMEQDGASRKEIWDKTGWERDSVGEWSFKIPPLPISEMGWNKLKTSQNWYGHPGYKSDDYAGGEFRYAKLLDLYPSKLLIRGYADVTLPPPIYHTDKNTIGDTKVFIHQKKEGVTRGGYWSRYTNSIHINVKEPITDELMEKPSTKRWIREVILHEVQHTIQDLDDKQMEVFDSVNNFSSYWNSWHEAQARAAEKESPDAPSQDEDIPRVVQTAPWRTILIDGKPVLVKADPDSDGIELVPGEDPIAPLSNDKINDLVDQIAAHDADVGMDSLRKMFQYLWDNNIVGQAGRHPSLNMAKDIISNLRRLTNRHMNEWFPNKMSHPLVRELLTEMRKYLPNLVWKDLGRDQYNVKTQAELDNERDRDRQVAAFEKASRQVISDDTVLRDFMIKYAAPDEGIEMGLAESIADLFAYEIKRFNSPDIDAEDGEYLITPEALARAEEMTWMWLKDVDKNEKAAWEDIGLDYAKNTWADLSKSKYYDDFDGGGWTQQQLQAGFETLTILANLLRAELAARDKSGDIRYKMLPEDIQKRLDAVRQMTEFKQRNDQALASKTAEQLAAKGFDKKEVEEKLSRQIRSAWREAAQDVNDIAAAVKIAGYETYVEKYNPKQYQDSLTFHDEDAITYAQEMGMTPVEAGDLLGADGYTWYTQGLKIFMKGNAYLDQYWKLQQEYQKQVERGINDPAMIERMNILLGLIDQAQKSYDYMKSNAGRLLHSARNQKSEMLQNMTLMSNQVVEDMERITREINQLQAELEEALKVQDEIDQMVTDLEQAYNELVAAIDAGTPESRAMAIPGAPTTTNAAQQGQQERLGNIKNRLDDMKKRQAENIKRVQAIREGIAARVDAVKGQEQHRKMLKEKIDELTKKPGRAPKPPKIHELPKMPATWYNIAKTMYYNNILSSPMTHYRNVMGNVSNLMAEMLVNIMTNPTATGKTLQGILSSIGEAKTASLQTIKDASAFLQKYDLSELDKSKTGLLKTFSLITRILAAEDAFFYTLAHGMQLQNLAAEQARQKGETRSFDEILDDALTAHKRLQDEAKTTNHNYEQMLLASNTAPEILKQAHYEAKRATFNQNPEGIVGIFNQAIETAVRSLENHPAGKPFALAFKFTVMPFTRIVANVMNFGIDWSPLGFIRAAQYNSKSLKIAEQEGIWKDNKGKVRLSPYQQRNVARQLARATLGTIALMLALTLLKGRVSGGGPRDPEKRKQLEAQGWKPYSLLIGKRWIPYNDWWFGMTLAVVGNIHDYNEYNRGYKPKDAWDSITYAMMGISKTMLDKSFLRGMSDTFAAVSSQDQSFVTRSVANVPGSFIPFSGAAKFVNDIFYTQKHRPETIVQYMLYNTRPLSDPWLRKSVPLDVDIFGEIATRPKQRSNVIGNPIAGEQPFYVYDRTNMPINIRKVLVAIQNAGLTISGTKAFEFRLTPGADEFFTIKGFDKQRFLQMRGREVALGCIDQQDTITFLSEQGERDQLEQVLENIARNATNNAKTQFMQELMKPNGEYDITKLRHKYTTYQKKE